MLEEVKVFQAGESFWDRCPLMVISKFLVVLFHHTCMDGVFYDTYALDRPSRRFHILEEVKEFGAG